MLDLKEIEGVITLDAFSFVDNRGKLLKSVCVSRDFANFEIAEVFFTFSHINVFRGLHLQVGEHGCNKIVSLLSGTVTHFLFDLRPESKTFKSLQIIQSSENKPKTIYIPEGVAHGYNTWEDQNVILYLYDVAFCSECDQTISGSILQEHLSINWEELNLSAKDKEADDSIERIVGYQ